MTTGFHGNPGSNSRSNIRQVNKEGRSYTVARAIGCPVQSS